MAKNNPTPQDNAKQILDYMKSKTHDFEGLFLLQLEMTQEMLKEMAFLAKQNDLDLPDYAEAMIEVYKQDPFKKWVKKAKKIFGDTV